MAKWSPLIAVCLGTFMLLVDVTIVTVALPDMAGDLKASFTGLQWVMDAYALVLAALVLGVGALADLIGRRRMYVIGLVVFGVASLACGLAPNPGLLIAARAVQGVGGAAMLATTIVLINVAYHGRDRGVAFGIWGAVSGAAAALGPILGGVLTQNLDWRWIFLINVPISVFTVVLTLRVVAESRNPQARGVDFPGTTAFSVALGSITYGLILAGEDGWTARGPLIWFAVGVVALVAFVLIERRSDRAALDLSLFRRPAFAGTMLAGMVMSFSAFGYGIYLSVWLQSIVRMTAIGAGLALIPMSIAALVVGGISGRLLHGVSVRLPIAGGLVLIGVGALMQAVLDGDSTWVAVLPGLAVSGAGVGLLSPTLPAAVMAAVPHERGGMASGALNTFRQLGMALGIAVLGTVVRGHGDFIGGLNVALIVAGVAGLVGGAVVLPLFQSPSKAGGRELTQPVRAS